MAQDWNGETGIMVTRYCGEPNPNGKRTNYQITLGSRCLMGITEDQAIELAILLIKATHQYRGEHD